MSSPVDQEAIEALITEKTELEMKMGDPSVARDQAKARKIGRRHAHLSQIAKAYTAWKLSLIHI